MTVRQPLWVFVVLFSVLATNLNAKEPNLDYSHCSSDLEPIEREVETGRALEGAGQFGVRTVIYVKNIYGYGETAAGSRTVVRY